MEFRLRHDEHRGKGSWDRAWKGFETARAEGFRVRLAATVSSDEEADEFSRFLDAHRVREEDRVIRRIALRGTATDGRCGLRRRISPRAASNSSPRAASGKVNGVALAQAWGAQATGYSVGPRWRSCASSDWATRASISASGVTAVAGFAVAAIGMSALGYATWPVFAVVVAAATLHASASCVLGPAIAAISLGLVGPVAMSERLRRNARFASLGSGIAAGVMGTCGYFLSSRSVFLVTFVLAVPTLLALARIRENETDIVRPHGAVRGRAMTTGMAGLGALLRQRGLVVFAGGVFMLQLANAAMLPLMAGVVTTRSSQWAPVLIAACIIVPQAIVALLSPSVGATAQAWGRRPLLMIGFAALVIRGLLFTTINDPGVLVAAQVFDGITAAVFGVMIPLTVADVSFGSGHFNLAQGLVGTATGIGASLSNGIAGYVSDRFGHTIAFAELSGVALLGLLLMFAFMPETRHTTSEGP